MEQNKLTTPQMNALLADFCCTPLTEEQIDHFEEKNDFGKEARSQSFANDYFRSLYFTTSLDAMQSVRDKMTEGQLNRFILELLLVAPHNEGKRFLGANWLFENSEAGALSLADVRFCSGANAYTQACAAIVALGLGKEQPTP